MKAEEPEAIYGRYAPNLTDSTHLVLAAQRGVSASIFDDVVSLYGHVSYISEIIELNPKTIKKYKAENISFSPLRSELLLKLVALFQKGVAVFGTRDAFLTWLGKAAHGLGGLIPFDLLKTSDGIGLVDDELDRIQYGATA
ncbi:MAG: DUF2384 domain-containing protein [Marinoscillum sp.]